MRILFQVSLFIKETVYVILNYMSLNRGILKFTRSLFKRTERPISYWIISTLKRQKYSHNT